MCVICGSHRFRSARMLFGVLCFAVLAARVGKTALQVMEGNFSRVVLFRQSEFIPRAMSIDEYCSAVDVVMGIAGNAFRRN